ncbi:hypothetical protein KUCAC02_017094 [Chaenocephalus aceratus]|uniref:Uncharacterized protein n=1 Tax=Chaenocephalus aceratus TaxID=36190 RepID=A0ACB9W144_CHAAC|nr:hypothetical protein KUCAC02_017094 [Chaenocephalus aceratus]
MKDTPAGTIIGAVTAQDLDASSSAVRYSIDWKSDLDSYFDIDPVEGTISTNELLDRESIAQHNISIVATKLNSPVLSSRVAVTVHVLDINEFPPELASPYETFVCEKLQSWDRLSSKESESVVGGDWRLVQGNSWDEASGLQQVKPGERGAFRSVGFRQSPETFGEQKEVESRQQSATEAAESAVCEQRGGQVIQTFSAQDQDLRAAGQQFSFKSPTEDMKNKNFTIRDFGNNTAGIVTKRGGFRRRLQEIYLLPVVIDDNGYPPKSSTGTLTIRVCGCESDGSLLTCSAEAIFLPVGLSTGALIAILLCIIILLVIVVLYVGLRRQKKKETLMSSKEDIRDNVIHYDDEGGGEEDTHAFDMGTLRNPKVVKENLFRRDVKPEMKRGPRAPVSQDSADIRHFINQRLKEHDVDNSAPPYDSLATYAYEGDGSVAESLSSIESIVIDPEEDYDYLNDWGPRFKTLAGIFGEHSETQSNSTTTENTH